MGEMFMGKYISDSAIKAGRDIAKKAKGQYADKKKEAKKDIDSCAMDMAKHFVSIARGRVAVVGMRLRPVKTMSNADRRRLGIEQDKALKDYR